MAEQNISIQVLAALGKTETPPVCGARWGAFRYSLVVYGEGGGGGGRETAGEGRGWRGCVGRRCEFYAL